MQIGPSTLARGYRWLLSVRVGRRVYRLADSAVAVSSTELGTLQFESGLENIDVKVELALEPGAADEITIPLRLRFPGSLAALWFAGVPLHLSTAELAILPDGGTWETRVVVMDGLLDLEELALQGEVVRATLASEAPEDDLGTILEDSKRITPLTHPLLIDPLQSTASGYGKHYPIPFGRPGMGQPGSPAIRFRDSGANWWHLIAGGPVAASSVTVIDGQDTSTSFSVNDGTDGLSQPYSYVVASSTEAGHAAEGADKLFVTWPEAGAMPDPFDGGIWNKATSLLRWMAQLSRNQYDLGSIVSNADVLDRYKLDGYWNAQGAPAEFIEDELLPILPLSMSPGPGGHFFTLIRKPPLKHECVDHLIEGQNCWRVGRPKIVRARADLSSRVRVEYGHSPVTDAPMSTLTLSAEDALHSDSGAAGRDETVQRSGLFEAFPSGGETVIGSRFVWRDSTAGLIATDAAVRSAVPVVEMDLRVDYDKARIQPGMGVLFTFSAYGISSLPCRVLYWVPTTTGMVLTLEVMRLPFRD